MSVMTGQPASHHSPVIILSDLSSTLYHIYFTEFDLYAGHNQRDTFVLPDICCWFVAGNVVSDYNERFNF